MDSFWWYITLRGKDGHEELLSTLADLSGSIGSEIQELPYGVRLRAYYHAHKDISAVLLEINERLESLYPNEAKNIRVEDSGRIENQPWHTDCEDAFPPLEVGENFVVLAPWHSAENAESLKFQDFSDKIPLIVKPGSAFGTGYHESTQIALELMEGRVKSGARALDIGTGSGILSIAAAKLGAIDITARDLDGAVLSEVMENLSLNDLGEDVRIRVEEGNLLDGFNEQVDLLIANITYEPITSLLRGAQKILKKDCYAIFSGLLLAERASFMRELDALGFECVQEKTRGEWWGVAAKNKA